MESGNQAINVRRVLRRLAAGVTIFAVAAASGCLFDADDSEQQAAVPVDEAIAFVSVDSLYFWIPVDSGDTTWAWNVAAEGMWDHLWTIDVPFPDRKFTVHFSMGRKSDGGAEAHGTFQEMAASAQFYWWSTDDETGAWIQQPWSIGQLEVRDNGVYLIPWQSAFVDIMFAYVKPPGYFATLNLERRSAGRATTHEPVHFDYAPDDAQLDARDISGPLSPDEYAIYDVVFTRHAREFRRDPLFLLTPSLGGERFREDTFQNVFVLDVDTETIDAFFDASEEKVDLAALGEVGYHILDARAEPRPAGDFIRAAPIGFGNKKTEALVYVVLYCGNLCGEGVVFHLKKLDGYWIVTQSVLIWIS